MIKFEKYITKKKKSTLLKKNWKERLSGNAKRI
jgi:hypothetical protein